MEREEDVIDAWYDSGSAPFAQWHYPFNKEKFQKNFPADFICEAIDQTRGWFYSLLAVSTIIFNKPPYLNVLSLGHILDKDGQKMSKRKKNYIQPDTIFNSEGADALRWYLVSANAPWHPIRFYEEIIKETMNKFLLTLWNIYSFFATYASLDNFEVKKDWVPIDSRGLLDRWLMSRLNHLIDDIEDKIERFELHKAARALEEFVMNDFSNWYIRCSRKRFWTEEATQDKYSGYSTVYYCLITLSKLVAPLVPFISDYIYQNMGEPNSVHLQDYPTSNKKSIDIQLEEKMTEVRKIVEIARSLRAKARIKLRQPLSRGIIVSDIDLGDLEDILKDELNVKEIFFETSCDAYMVKIARANYSTLGPKFKKKASFIAEEINKLSYEDALKGKVTVDGQDFFYDQQDIIIETREQENLLSAQSEGTTIILDTELSQDLKDEGFAREIVRRIQEMRKQMDLEMNESISSMISIGYERMKKWIAYIKDETRSIELICSENVQGDAVKEWKIEEETVTIGLARV
jgi:isoleucyl-tRNA synthetase